MIGPAIVGNMASTVVIGGRVLLPLVLVSWTACHQYLSGQTDSRPLWCQYVTAAKARYLHCDIKIPSEHFILIRHCSLEIRSVIVLYLVGLGCVCSLPVSWPRASSRAADGLAAIQFRLGGSFVCWLHRVVIQLPIICMPQRFSRPTILSVTNIHGPA